MRNRFLLAAGTLAAFVPTLAMAQQRPATPPPQRPATPPQRPAAQPAQRPASTMSTGNRAGAIALGLAPAVFIERDDALFGYLYNNVADVPGGDTPNRYLPGAVGTIGYAVSPSVGVGVGLGVGVTSGLTLIQPSVGLQFTFSPASRLSPYLTVSGAASRFTGDGPAERATGVGGHGSLGIRYMSSENLALRLEGRVGAERYSTEDISAVVGRVSAGFSYLTGGGPPRDTDGDGVPDNRDRCASTQRGATVDVRGCPSDTDRDGVLNGLDRCPNTPANTPVDANGCTRDTDSDGIADNLDRCPNTPSNARPLDANGCPVDTDRDAVPDFQDRCANTPAGTPVDANGCPRDADSDGVLDSADRCPNTAAGTPVDANGCPRDTDGDGVADNNDRCPNTAAGTQVDATGCPVARDADHDGVIDDRDRCANTPAGRQVDANGCPLAELPTATTPIVLRNVPFRPGTARLLPSSAATLDPIAAAIVANPGSRFEVGGHSDATGVAATNMRLSQARAQAVVTYLVSKGVPAASLTAVGYGSQHPVAPNTTAAGRAQNRRVELKRL